MSDPRSTRHEADHDDLPEPPKIRALRRLVTALTLVLILGTITIAVTLALRITRSPATPPLTVTAESVSLPSGERITASGAAQGLLMLVTQDAAGLERLRLYDPTTGVLHHVVLIERTDD
jgi:hypothetical protein